MPSAGQLSQDETAAVFENDSDGVFSGPAGFPFRTDGFQPGNLLRKSLADGFGGDRCVLENAPDGFECLTDVHDGTKNAEGGQFKYVGETFKYGGGVFQYAGGAKSARRRLETNGAKAR